MITQETYYKSCSGLLEHYWLPETDYVLFKIYNYDYEYVFFSAILISKLIERLNLVWNKVSIHVISHIYHVILNFNKGICIKEQFEFRRPSAY